MNEQNVQYDERYFNTASSIGNHVIVDETSDKWLFLDDSYGCLDAPELIPAGSTYNRMQQPFENFTAR